MNCEALQSGDLVWVEFMSFGRRLKRHERIGRVTPTQIISDNRLNRYHRVGGSQIGGLSGQIIAQATAAEILAFEMAKAIEERREKKLDKQEAQLRALLGRREFELRRDGETYGLNLFSLNAGQVDAIATLLKESHGRNKRNRSNKRTEQG